MKKAVELKPGQEKELEESLLQRVLSVAKDISETGISKEDFKKQVTGSGHPVTGAPAWLHEFVDVIWDLIDYFRK